MYLKRFQMNMHATMQGMNINSPLFDIRLDTQLRVRANISSNL